TTRIDYERYLANSKCKYKLYFNLLHSKIHEHSVNKCNMYNIKRKASLLALTVALKG
ncbi:uncharacterized protein M421DRAFT_76551, partial [Didymella exigua CBS 183.55]